MSQPCHSPGTAGHSHVTAGHSHAQQVTAMAQPVTDMSQGHGSWSCLVAPSSGRHRVTGRGQTMWCRQLPRQCIYKVEMPTLSREVEIFRHTHRPLDAAPYIRTIQGHSLGLIAGSTTVNARLPLYRPTLAATRSNWLSSHIHFGSLSPLSFGNTL